MTQGHGSDVLPHFTLLPQQLVPHPDAETFPFLFLARTKPPLVAQSLVTGLIL